MDYRVSAVVSWCTAVPFASATNKLFVFQSRDLSLELLWKGFASFAGYRTATGVFTIVAMIAMVDYLHLDEFIGKSFVPVISLALDYIFNKLFISKENHDGEDK